MIIVPSVNEHAKPNVGHGKPTLPRKGNQMSVTFTKDKETKNAFRFTASGEISGSLYVPKDHEFATETEIVAALEVSEKVEVSAWQMPIYTV